MSQSLSIRAMSFDDDMTNPSAGGNRSQSLSIRAMSFDLIYYHYYGDLLCRLNPFRSGQCLSTDSFCSYWCSCFVSIPFDQGNVFRLNNAIRSVATGIGLNPFRSGQCLSTQMKSLLLSVNKNVSIPFDQGNVFRL